MFDFNDSSSLDKIIWMGTELQARQNALRLLSAYYEGTQGSTFLPPALMAELGPNLPTLNVNYCRKTVSALTDRLKVTGFKVNGSSENDSAVWQTWNRNKMPTRLDWALKDALSVGTGYASVWTNNGRASIAIESPLEVYPVFDPVTREPIAYLKQTSSFDTLNNVGRSWSILHLPDRIETWVSDSPAPPNQIAAGGWRHVSTVPNPLNTLMIVPLVNATDVLSFYGESEYADLIPLVDWLAKSCWDLASASDASGMPRKFISGLAVKFDADGNPIEPFRGSKTRTMQAENENAKMTQLEGAPLTNFVAQSRFIISQIGAISALPENELGLTTSQPASADGLRAANLGLTTRAQNKTELFGSSIGRIAALARAVESGENPDSLYVEPVWGQIEDRSQSMATDSYLKLVNGGIPPRLAAQKALGYSADEAAQIPEQTEQKVIAA